MYLAGVSVRQVEDITEALWGTRVSPGTISNLNKKVYKQIEAWRNRPIEGTFPYVYLDGIVLKRSWAGEVSNVSVLVAIGVSEDGYRKILGICEGAKEDKAGWSGFLRHLKERGLGGVRLFITDACMGLVESIADFYPEARWQRFMVHFLQERFQCRAVEEDRGSGGHAQGDSCLGRQQRCHGEGRDSSCKAAVIEA
jgi:transposase-like protein